MARAYTTQNVLLDNSQQAVGASQTAQVVSETFALSADDSLAFDAAITISGSDFTGANVNLYHSFDGTTFVEVAKAAVSMTGGAGTYYLKFLAQISGDQTSLPLRPKARIAVDSGTGADFDVDAITITRRK